MDGVVFPRAQRRRKRRRGGEGPGLAEPTPTPICRNGSTCSITFGGWSHPGER
jgi:hypothetical protein